MSSNDDRYDTALATDLYQLAMAAAYYFSAYHNDSKMRGIFELFVRTLPRNRSYLVAAGLEQIIHFILNMKFNDNHISYLKSLEIFQHIPSVFFDYLRRFNFTGDVWAVHEGTILFPYEPIIRVEAPIIEAQIIESYILSMINFQSLIATKASRVVTAAKGRPVIEFGSRRAHGPQAAFLAARAAYIAGCIGTSNTLAGYKLGIPVFGTMAHSFIMSFEKEEEAFQQFNYVFPHAFLLVDTYDTINAIKNIVKLGIKTNGIRLDSGDLHFLSIQARNLLDNVEGGKYSNTKIMASGDLNEYIIRDLVNKNAPIDFFGVGTELSTSRDDPAMNGLYKLVAVKLIQPSSSNNNNRIAEDDHTIMKIQYKLKTSIGKKNYPAPKQIYRLLKNNALKVDYIALEDENDFPEGSIPLLQKYIHKGKIACEMPSIKQIQDYHINQLQLLPTQFKDLDFIPKQFPITYSKKLEEILQQFKIY
jgi:nicotinate phosphoribosyltransferase